MFYETYFKVATLISFKTSFETLTFPCQFNNKSISGSSYFLLNLFKMGFFGPIDNVSSTYFGGWMSNSKSLTVSWTLNKRRSCCLDRLSNFFWWVDATSKEMFSTDGLKLLPNKCSVLSSLNKEPLKWLEYDIDLSQYFMSIINFLFMFI